MHLKKLIALIINYNSITRTQIPIV